MLMFTLVISCLTTSNLPWFMGLTFQVPMQYCSLHHWTLLKPVPSTTGCCFCFCSIPSFFLELFLHWYPEHIGHLLSWGFHLSVSYFLPFHTVHGVLKAIILKWFAIPFSSGPHFVRHGSNIILKIFQARLQQYRELPDVQSGFRKSRGNRDQIANIC